VEPIDGRERRSKIIVASNKQIKPQDRRTHLVKSGLDPVRASREAAGKAERKPEGKPGTRVRTSGQLLYGHC